MPGPAYRPKPNQHQSYKRLNKFVSGWLLGGQGLSGAGRELIHSVDPRTKAGLLNAMAMLVPGKPSGEGAMSAFLGHSEFRPYHTGGLNYKGKLASNDSFVHGGSLSGGADYGYPNNIQGGYAHADAIDAIHNVLMGKQSDMLLEHLLAKPYRNQRVRKNNLPDGPRIRDPWESLGN